MSQQDPSLVESIRKMREEGDEQIIPETLRKVRLRTIEAKELLREGSFPDILTPLVVRSVYQELVNKDINDFFSLKTEDIEQAKKMLEAIDFVCRKAIADDTQLDDLTMSEKRWIFRLAVGPAEMLVTFRYEPQPDVEFVDEVQELQPVT